MKTKSKVPLAVALIASLLLGGALAWLIRQNIQLPQSHKFDAAELRQILEKSSSEAEIQADVDGLIGLFGEEFRFLNDPDLGSAPGLVQYAKALDDATVAYHNEALHIEANDEAGQGIPCHVWLRFGQHLTAQVILIFRTGADLSSLGPGYERVAGNIYLRRD